MASLTVPFHHPIKGETAFQKKSLQAALVDLKLEGITLSDDLMSDFALIDAGKITHKETIERAVARAKKVDKEKQKAKLHVLDSFK